MSRIGIGGPGAGVEKDRQYVRRMIFWGPGEGISTVQPEQAFLLPPAPTEWLPKDQVFDVRRLIVTAYATMIWCFSSTTAD